ncbi:hypothetical protein ABZ642_45540 [Streptomyces sp. NPDC007157]|uniref:hypothetical protein n=1 Tax=Streptomyces sp. NPDC007157 TaxID=3154681 RepID=UPI0033E9721A
MEKESGGQLPRSTANVIANGHTLPRDFRQYVAFLRVCGLDGQALAPWFRAWFKIIGRPGVPAVAVMLKSLGSCVYARRAYLDVYLEDGLISDEERKYLTGIDQHGAGYTEVHGDMDRWIQQLDSYTHAVLPWIDAKRYVHGPAHQRSRAAQTFRSYQSMDRTSDGKKLLMLIDALKGVAQACVRAG